jgi:hypothetical protein
MTEAQPRANVFWLETHYYPTDQGGKEIREPHRMHINTANLATIRENDNDLAVGSQCHITTTTGVDYTIAESYDSITSRI